MTTRSPKADRRPPLIESRIPEIASRTRPNLFDLGIALFSALAGAYAFIRGRDYGTRASTLILVGHDGRARIHERRFGPDGVVAGETVLDSGD